MDALRSSIQDSGDAVYCGNIRDIAKGKEVWPEGQIRAKTVVGKGSAARTLSNTDTL